jgi:hypothetical protein
MFYNSNFDKSQFEEVKFRELNKTIDDPCAQQQRVNDNSKKLKFVTTNHADLLNAKNALNYYGMTLKDHLFVPSEKIDGDSNLRLGEKGNILTNCHVKNEYGQLPVPTMPSRYQLSHGDVGIEDSMRNLLETNRQSCNPRDISFHDRSFYIFDDKKGIETPDATKSVEPNEFGPRGGLSTRFDKRRKL